MWRWVNTFADGLGLSGSKLSNCIEDEKFKDEIANDLSDARSAGINGTPGFVVGTLDNDGIVEGEVISGALPYSSFQAVIESYL